MCGISNGSPCFEHMKTKQTDSQQIDAQNPLTMHDTNVDNDGDLDDTGMLHEEREYMWGDYVTPHPSTPHTQLNFNNCLFLLPCLNSCKCKQLFTSLLVHQVKMSELLNVEFG